MGINSKKRSGSSSPVSTYINDIIERYKDGFNATEHTHRPALQNMLETLLDGVMATNEPQRIDCGAPDFILTSGQVPLGYIEAKDLDKNLDEQEESEQLQRYFGSLDNLILTNYFEFRWYIKGELRSSCTIASLSKKKIIPNEECYEELASMLEAFRRTKIPLIKTASELAERLAGSTRSIYLLIQKAYEVEPETGYLHKWMSAFRSVLIADLDVPRFADMFAQTLVYGYFSARAHQDESTSFSRESASRILPETNPFLRRLFHEFAGLDMPTVIDWAVDEVVELLRRTEVKSVLKDFGAKSGKNDPIFHFYETFLEKYNPELKDALGAYYTPQPVIDYIVKSVDKVLQTHFNRTKGLADKNTLVLDPATGTGSFLFHVIESIREKMKGQDGTWPQYVSEHLLGRIFGFEIMMAPYSVAHLKIGNQLKSSGYKFDSGKRLGIYLTNTLEEAARKTDTFFAEFVSNEANEAAAIKSDKPIVAVIGNPPYKGFAQNHGNWIQSLMEDYKEGLGEKKNNSDNDYMKFIRFAQWRIDRTKHGVAAFITPNSFLDAITLRQMRSSLLKSFSEIYVLNLHGSAMVEHAKAKAAKDKNVFDIRQGVSITIFVRKEVAAEEKPEPCKVFYSEIIGSRESKYQYLLANDISSTKWTELPVSNERNFFSPLSLEKNDDYLSFMSVKDIFPISTSGIQPKKKDIAIQFTEEQIKEVISDLAHSDDDAEFKKKYDLDKESNGWKIEWARNHAKEFLKHEMKPTRIQYRTFDYRWTVIEDYSGGIVGRPRYDVMRHLKRPNNIGMILLRQLSQSSFQHAWVTRSPIDENTISRKTREYNYIFPLFLEPDADQLTTHQQRLNISEAAKKNIETNWAMKLTEGLHGDFESTIGPEQFFYYIYAIVHSPYYRKAYFSELKIDFPRIPFFHNKALVKRLSEIGKELSSLHLFEHSSQQEPTVTFPVRGSNMLSELTFKSDEGRIYINEEQYFEGVLESDWTFKVGGHEVLREYFTDRMERELTSDEIENIRMIAVSFGKTAELMLEVDSEVFKCGGWPKGETTQKVQKPIIAARVTSKKKSKKTPAA